MNIAIYSKSELYADRASRLMSVYGLKHGFYNQYYTFHAADELLLSAAEKGYKVFVLHMIDQDDLMLLVKARAMYKDCRLIIITDNNEYALTSFYIPVDFCTSSKDLEANAANIFRRLI